MMLGGQLSAPPSERPIGNGPPCIGLDAQQLVGTSSPQLFARPAHDPVWRPPPSPCAPLSLPPSRDATPGDPDEQANDLSATPPQAMATTNQEARRENAARCRSAPWLKSDSPFVPSLPDREIPRVRGSARGSFDD